MVISMFDSRWSRLRNIINYACKSLRLSQLIYTAPMLSVPETVIQQTQCKLFAFLRKNKKDKIKRQVLFRPLSKGGLIKLPLLQNCYKSTTSQLD